MSGIWSGVGVAAGSIGGALLSRNSGGGKMSNEQKDQIREQTAGMHDQREYSDVVWRQANALGMSPQQYVAQLSPMQLKALNMTSGSLGFGQKDNDALRKTIGGANYGYFGAKDIKEFMDPYTNDVVNTTNADIDRQRQIALVGGETAANSVGAFGGSRHGVADAGTNEAALRTTASADANIREHGFDTASQLAAQRANQVGGFKVAGNAQLAQLLQEKYNMNAADIDRMFNGGALQQGVDQNNKNWALKRLSILNGVRSPGGGPSNFEYTPQPNSFSSTVQGAQWGAQVGSDIASYFKNRTTPSAPSVNGP